MENFNNLQENLNYVEMRTVNAAREKNSFQNTHKTKLPDKNVDIQSKPTREVGF